MILVGDLNWHLEALASLHILLVHDRVKDLYLNYALVHEIVDVKDLPLNLVLVHEMVIPKDHW